MKTNTKQTARGKAVKQLNQNNKRNTTQRKSRPIYRDAVTNIPTTVAYTINNRTTTAKHHERAKEYIGIIRVGPSTASGSSFVFALNPVNYQTTRFGRLASAYEKFRFRAARLTVAANFSTTVSGSLIAGFMENPDQDVQPAPAIFNQVFSAVSGVSQSLWKPVDVTARFTDKNKWYNIDEDSQEVMQTTQGKFVIVVQSPVSLSDWVDIPILLEYDIEFSGQATQQLNTQPFGPVISYSGNSYIQRSSEGPGEYHAESAGTTVEQNVIYKFTIPQQVENVGGEMSYIVYMVYSDSPNRSHSFYQTYANAIALQNKILAKGQAFTMMAAEIQRVNY